MIVTGLPSNSSSPLSTSRLPVIALTIVDFPAPLSPINATTSPASTSKSASIRARTWPKLRERPRASRMGVLVSAGASGRWAPAVVDG